MTEVARGNVAATRVNEKGIHSIALGEGDNVEWYSFYTNNPGVSKGDQVEFAYTRKGRWLNGDAKTVKVVGKASAPSNATQRSVSTGGGYDARQDSIIMQSSMKTAADLLKVAVEAGAVPLGKMATAKTQEKGYETILSVHADLSRRLFNRAKYPEKFLASLQADVVEEEVVSVDDDGIGDTGDADFQDF